MTKPALSYFARDNLLHNRSVDWVLSPPEVGFLFPAFDDRAANLYNALYYSRNLAENHEELAEAVFHCDLPMPAAEQRETFDTVLGETLEEDCSLDVVQSVQERLQEMIQGHKERKEAEQLTLSVRTVKNVLEGCGAVSYTHLLYGGLSVRNWRGHYYQAGFGFVGPYACGKRQLFIRLYGFGNDRFFRWENVSRRESGDRRGAGNASGRRSRYRRRSGAVPLLSNRGNSFRYGCFGNGSDRNFIDVYKRQRLDSGEKRRFPALSVAAGT